MESDLHTSKQPEEVPHVHQANFQKVPDLHKNLLTNKKWCQIEITVTY